VKNETSTVVFNTSALDIRDVSIYSQTLQSQQSPSSQFSDKALERATLQFLTPLPAGSKAELRVGFQGNLTGAMMGYYKSSWEHEGKKKYYALTQFEVWFSLNIFHVLTNSLTNHSPRPHEEHFHVGTNRY